MPTLLTNSKMSPALARRIEASIRKGRPGGMAVERRFVALFRFVTLVGIVVAAVSLVFLKRRESADLERSRAELLARVQKESASLLAEDRSAVDRVEVWLTRAAGPYEGDYVDESLRAPGALATVLAAPVIYVRGPLADFRGSTGIEEASGSSRKDPFLLCLLDRPSTRSESAMLAKVHAAFSGGPHFREHTANAHRLFDAVVGLPLLQPSWRAKVRAANTQEDVVRLEHELDHAPLDEAKKAAAAHVLLFAMDEPGASGGLSELDGERPHDVRVGVVDLGVGRVWLRLRKHADPSWISLGKRADYASGLDGCALALDVHESVTTTNGAAAQVNYDPRR